MTEAKDNDWNASTGEHPDNLRGNACPKKGSETCVDRSRKKVDTFHTRGRLSRLFTMTIHGDSACILLEG